MADEKDQADKAQDKPDTAKKAPAKAAASKAAGTKAAAADKPAAEKKAAPAKATAAKTDAEKPAAKATAAKADAEKPTAKADKADTAASTAKATTAKSASKPAAKKDDDVAEPRVPVLKVHHLRPAAGSKKDRTRVGRGEGSKGKTAGRGTKGTKARYQVRPGFQGGQLPFHMRSPKLRGFKNPFRVEYQVVNLERLAELYPSGGEVTVGDLVAKGAVRKNEKVKVLGSGDIAVKLDVAVDKVSGSAEQKILAAGGSIK
jgi:large subunit ribosomal protein L15